jgi:gamma-glutamyltranspeptidase/glutathione hydrolase
MVAALAFTLFTQGQHPARYEHGAVVSDHHLASEVGQEILKLGGNAVDSAVATGLALAVTYPSAGNLGGGGFMIIRLKSGESFALDYREIAPALATRDMYLDKDGKLTNKSVRGHLASGIPGTVAGFAAAHKRFGKLPWSTVFQPAIKLAKEGFKLSPYEADGYRRFAQDFKEFQGTWAQFGLNGKFAKAGETFRQPDLAKTLERIKTQGADGFYKGETANLIVQEMKRGGGIISAKDLADYKPSWRTPLFGKFRGYDVITMPPPSSGGGVLLEMLGMLGEDEELGDWGSAKSIHLMSEVMRRAFADRAELYGDPDYVKVPLDDLLKPDYLKARRATIDPKKATPSAEVKPGVSPKEGNNTTHFSVVDSEGNAVSNTYTLNTGHGSGVTVTGAGFLLNNEMDDFAAKVGTPNAFGLIQGERNAVAPGRRPLSSMTPTMLVKDGQLALVLGSPGGPTIINTVFQTILNVVVHRFDVQKAVAAPRIHHQWMPDQIRTEPMAMSPDTRSLLEGMGHAVRRESSWGSCHAIWVDPKSGERRVGCDPRISTAGHSGY